MVACMTANGRFPPSANASPRQTTRVRPPRHQPERAGGPPPQFRRPGGHPPELLVGPPLLGRAHDPRGVVLPAHVVHHHRHHVLAFSPIWLVTKTTNGNTPDGQASQWRGR